MSYMTLSSQEEPPLFVLSRASDNTTSQNIGGDGCMGRPPTSNCGDRPPSPVSAPGCKSYFFSTSIIHYYYVKPFAVVNANEWTGCLQCLKLIFLVRLSQSLGRLMVA